MTTVRKIFLMLIASGTIALCSCSQQQSAPTAQQPPAREESCRIFRVKERTVLYKTVRDFKLNLHIFEPETRPSDEPLPAIVMFFGGHWFTGAPQQFYPQCEYFASRGMVAMTAEYRTGRKHKAKPFHSVADAKSAVRWIRSHADELGIDPDKIVAGGGEAGGHLAACTGIIDGLDQNKEDLAISSFPNALILLSPVLDTSEEGFPIGYGTIKERWKQISPVHNVKPGAPPTIICHGTADTYAPYKYAEQFTDLMKQAGNECKLVPYEDQKQAFFNHFLFRPFPTNQYYREVLRACDRFLVSLGYLDGEPTL